VTRRLIISYLAVTVVVLVLLEVPMGVFFAQRELERLTSAVERDAAVVATIYEDALEKGQPLDPRPAQLYQARTGARVVVVNADGISLVDTEQTINRDFSTRPEIATALGGDRSVGTRESETLATELLYVALPVASGGVVHGALRITLDTAAVDANVHRFWMGLVAIAAVVLAAMSLVGWLVARSVTLPMRRLNDTAKRFGEGDLTVEGYAIDGPRELQELASTMSTMAEQLADLIDEQRAFVADASHQLRTPLTGLRLRLENLQAGLADADAAQVDAAIEEITRLSTLVADLLQLARADRHDSPGPHDIAVLAGERVDTWTAMAETMDIDLQLTSARSGVIAAAVPGAIEQILDNLIDNALSAGPVGSTVRVTVETGSLTHRLIVADQGGGLSDDDKTRATRRFWRGDTSAPGTGLGLAIAESLAKASGGSLALTDAEGGGLAVVVDFPAWPVGIDDAAPAHHDEGSASSRRASR
jgi:signal transduction histidine kinase